MTEAAKRGAWTKPLGGNGGQEFALWNDHYTVTGVRGRAGDWIDQLAFDFSDLKTGEMETSKELGGTGGGDFYWHFPANTEITKVVIWALPDQYVHGLQFHFKNHTSSPMFGQTTGEKSEINLLKSRIAGFGGRVGHYLDQIKFYLVDHK